MSAVFESPSIWQRARPILTGYDVPLVLAVGLLAIAGLVTMYSAGHDQGTRFVDHGRNMALAFGVLFLAAQIAPQQLIKLAIPLYVVGLILLLATALPGLGVTRKGPFGHLSCDARGRELACVYQRATTEREGLQEDPGKLSTVLVRFTLPKLAPSSAIAAK